jgi:iron complex outermembrane receptor protein
VVPTRLAAVLAILLAAGPQPVASQAGVIRGQVIRADRGVGLPDVDLVLRPSGATTLSDARGSFVFRDVAPGRVELDARRLGFAPATVVLEVDSLRATEVEVVLEAVVTILEPIITTVTRDERSLAEVAAAVAVADSSAIGDGRTVGLHETLRLMPGVQAVSRYGTEDVNIGIRGSASRVPQAVRGVAVLLDGVPLTEPDGVARPDLIELAAASQVEVVRGPVSALYAGAPGGMVNVVSRTGRDSPGVSLRASGGSFGFRKVEGHAGWVYAGSGSGFVAASHTSTDGYRAHSDAEILRGQMMLDYVVGPRTRVAIEASGSRLDSNLPGALTQAELDAEPDAAAPTALRFGVGRDDRRFRGGLRLEHGVDTGVASGWFFYGGRTLQLPIPFQLVDLNLHRVQAGTRVRSGPVAVGLDYDHVFGTDQRWENNPSDRSVRFDDGRLAVRNLGPYAQVEWAVAPAVEATVGLRYDRVTYHFESYVPGPYPQQETVFDQISPRLSAVWTADSVTSLYASIGHGFEVPAIAELSGSPGAELSLSLRPKSLWNYEVGARRVVGDRALLEASVFYADVRGEFVPRTVDELSQPENASRSRNIGLELGITARAARRLDLAATYTFLHLRLLDYTTVVLGATGTYDTVDFSGKILPAVPQHRLTGDVRLRPTAELGIGVQVEWQGVTYVETGNVDEGIWYARGAGGSVEAVPFRAVPSRVVVQVNAAYRIGPATLFGSVENLFGLRYAGNVVSNDFSGRFYEPASPTWISLGLRLDGWRSGP